MPQLPSVSYRDNPKSANRKIWVFITEAEWNVHASVKDSYVARIRGCKHQLLKPTDRVVMLYNKVDQKKSFLKTDTCMFHRLRTL